jgi:UDP-N-acetylmuramoylalanine--D-glutamate ligase
LKGSLDEIAGLDVTLRLGGHDPRDFRETDLVVASPAVPNDSPYLLAAREGGVPATTEINLFVERCPARCIGVTGSVGKSTITAMIGHLLRETMEDRRVWVGGNIGRSLLEDLAGIKAEDLVVLELSSFQLEHAPAVRWSPHVAVITNITPNHLDRHGTFDAYVAAKLNIVRFQNPAGDVVVIEDAEELKRNLRPDLGLRSGVWCYGLHANTPIATAWTDSPAAADQCVDWSDVELAIPGRHNRQNAAAALTVAHTLGVARAEASAALTTFPGLPHRLQRVASRDGVTYFNDSKSTTPEAAITAMNAIDGPLLMILGGYDKGIDLSTAARTAAQRARFSACVGQTGATLAKTICAVGGEAAVFDDLPAAVAACRQRAQAGDTVLLSPGCASWDMFDDYRARGDAFTRLAEGTT